MPWIFVADSSSLRRRHAQAAMSSAICRAQRGVAVGHRLDGHADIGHVRPREAEEHVDVSVGLARLPDQRALDQVHPRPLAGPLQHGRRDDRHVHRDVSADRSRRGSRAPACAPRAGPGDGCRSAGKYFTAECHVGVAQKFGVLVAVRVEGAGDARLRPDHFAHAPRQFRLGARNAARRHRAVHAEIDAVEFSSVLQPPDHPADEMLVRIFGHPA